MTRVMDPVRSGAASKAGLEAWKRPRRKPYERGITDREIQAWTWRREGYTFAAIGLRLGISRNQARQLVVRAERRHVS